MLLTDEQLEAAAQILGWYNRSYSDDGIAEDIDKGHCKFRKDRPPFDFGYALTVHSAQGSEWPRVIVWDDFNARAYRPAEYAKWLYTAITRAAKGCLVAA
jgi:superfamily I DNA/RNA helicase